MIARNKANRNASFNAWVSADNQARRNIANKNSSSTSTSKTSTSTAKTSTSTAKTSTSTILKTSTYKPTTSTYKSSTSTSGKTINNSSSYKSLTGTSYADTVWNSYSGNGVTISTGAGNDSVQNWGDTVKVYTGAGNDYIYSYSSSSTINGGTGSDTISLNSSARNNVITYASGDGNDKIYNLGSSNKLSITGGSYSTATSGNDIVVTVGTGKITLVGAKGTTPNIIGTKKSSASTYTPSYTSTGGKTINNSSSYKSLTGTSYADTVWNSYSGNGVTISTGAGNDTVQNWGDTVKVYTGAGNDYIYSYSYNSTINGGAGSDTISLNSSARNNVITYASGDGNDKIYNLGSSNKLSITGGSYSTATSGNDIVVTVGSGKITLVGAKGTTPNIIGTKASTYYNSSSYNSTSSRIARLSSLVNNLSSSKSSFTGLSNVVADEEVTTAPVLKSASGAEKDWISADDKNFTGKSSDLSALVNSGLTNYSTDVVSSSSNLTNLTKKNNIVTFSGKK